MSSAASTLCLCCRSIIPRFTAAAACPSVSIDASNHEEAQQVEVVVWEECWCIYTRCDSRSCVSTKLGNPRFARRDSSDSPKRSQSPSRKLWISVCVVSVNARSSVVIIGGWSVFIPRHCACTSHEMCVSNEWSEMKTWSRRVQRLVTLCWCAGMTLALNPARLLLRPHEGFGTACVAFALRGGRGLLVGAFEVL